MNRGLLALIITLAVFFICIIVLGNRTEDLKARVYWLEKKVTALSEVREVR